MYLRSRIEKAIEKIDNEGVIAAYKSMVRMKKNAKTRENTESRFDKCKITLRDTETGEIFKMEFGEVKKLPIEIIRNWEYVPSKYSYSGKLYMTFNEACKAGRFRDLKKGRLDNV